MTRTQRVSQHHAAEFPDVSIERIMLKLMEECGELASEIYNDDREGIERELGDVLTVLTAVAGRYSLNADQVAQEAAERFCRRTWQ